MRKFSVLLLAMALALFSAAFAEETRTGTIELEGTTERIHETRFISDQGYAFWYDSDRYAAAESDPHDHSVTVSPADPDNVMPIFLKITPASESFYTGDDYLIQTPAGMGVTTQPIEEMKTDSGVTLRYCFGSKYKLHYEFFTASGSGPELQILLQCPAEAAEGHGGRLLRVLQTLEYTEAEAPADDAVELHKYYAADLEQSAAELSLPRLEDVVSEIPHQYGNDDVLLAGNLGVNYIRIQSEGYSLFGAEIGMDIGTVQELFAEAPLELNAAFDDFYIFEHRAIGTFKDAELFDSSIIIYIDPNGNVTEMEWSSYTC